MFNKVIVTGSLAYDHIMSMPGRFRDHILSDKLHILNVSFIMNTFRQEFGGTGGNIAWTLGLLKIPCVLVGAVGNDFSPYARHLKKVKSLDISPVRIYEKDLTARGFVTTDRDDNQIWGFYEGAMKESKHLSLKKYLQKDAIVMIAPNDPAAMIRYVTEASESHTAYIFDPAFNIPHFARNVFRKAVRNAHIVIGNDYEVELMAVKLGWTKTQLAKNTRILITTLGSKGSIVQTEGKKIRIPAAKPENISDPTGAGDAFRAGFLSGLVKGYPLTVCAKMGAVAGVYTVEKYGTQTHFFNNKEFVKRYRKNYSDGFEFTL